MSMSRFRFMTLSLLFAVALMALASCGSRRSTTLRAPGHRPGAANASDSRPRPAAPTRDAPRAAGRHTTTSSQSYIERYKDIAIAEMNQYGIPASIKLAQALLESGNGNSYLAREANNHFGIKCGSVWNGPSIRRPDDGPNDCFRVYQNPDESFKDHSQFLLRKRYEALFALRKDDYQGWAHGLRKAGYATNPRYAYLLIDLIERYQLHQYDRQESSSEQQQREETVEEIIQQKETVQGEEPTEAVKKPVAMVIYEVKANDTLYGIARQYNLTIEELKTNNGLVDDKLYPGQLLVVSP